MCPRCDFLGLSKWDERIILHFFFYRWPFFLGICRSEILELWTKRVSSELYTFIAVFVTFKEATISVSPVEQRVQHSRYLSIHLALLFIYAMYISFRFALIIVPLLFNTSPWFRPEVTLCCWQDVKMQLLSNLPWLILLSWLHQHQAAVCISAYVAIFSDCLHEMHV